MKLSILITTIEERAAHLARLLGRLSPQCGPETELIWCGDNRRRSKGEKRNDLISMARGDYLCLLDDDDIVVPDFVASILAKIEDAPDVIVYDAIHLRGDGTEERLAFSSRETSHGIWPPRGVVTFARFWHTWRSSLAKTIPFPPANFGEDMEWGYRASLKAQSEARIDRPLFWYDETRRLT